VPGRQRRAPLPTAARRAGRARAALAPRGDPPILALTIQRSSAGSWREVQAEEVGEASATLLTELREEIPEARELPQEEGHALAVQDIAERLGLPVDHAEKMLAALEA